MAWSAVVSRRVSWIAQTSNRSTTATMHASACQPRFVVARRGGAMLAQRVRLLPDGTIQGYAHPNDKLCCAGSSSSTAPTRT